MLSDIEEIRSEIRIPETRLRVVTESRPADMLTPVSLYLKVRDRFPGSIMLESAENQHGKNSRSFIGFDRIANIQADRNSVRVKCSTEETFFPTDEINPFDVLQQFISSFKTDKDNAGAGLLGYIGYNAIQFIEPSVGIQSNNDLPVFNFSLFRFVIEFDHLRQTLKIVQYVEGDNEPKSLPPDLLTGTPGTVYPFRLSGEENAFTTETQFKNNVQKGKDHCRRGDVFQVVISRRFSQQFAGDDFNVYRTLRMINPSPYLFYADFLDFRLFGSSPEALLITKNNTAEIHPIAGTYRKTGDEAIDLKAESDLIADKKENSEHIMLVDLARNDLSRFCSKIEVKEYRSVQHFSHVIHLVSKVCGKVNDVNVVDQIKNVFPAGTLSGAPKVRAMQIINETENVSRDWYGGCIGAIGFDGTINTAILIRTFMSRNNELHYQAGAGIVIDSDPEKELNEVNHKLGALRSAMTMATKL